MAVLLGLECGALRDANTIYNLNQSLNSPGTCFTVLAPNVTINCSGYEFVNEGRLYEGFNDNETWSLQADGARINFDTMRISEGDGSIRVETGTSKSAAMDTIINTDFSNVKNIFYEVYVEDLNDLPKGSNAIIMYLSSNPFKTYFTCRMGTNYLKQGWNRIVMDKENQCSSFNGEDWNNQMKRIRIRFYAANETANATYYIDNMRLDYQGGRAGKPVVLITFDDGYKDNIENAYPVLSRNGQVATEFVITSKLNSSGFLDMGDMAFLYEKGWDIASHSVNHPQLTELTAEQLQVELGEAKDNLTAWGFGKSARFFAYPYHNYNATVINEVSKYYSLARDGLDSLAQAHFYENQSDIPHLLKAEVVVNSTPVQHLRDEIDKVINTNGLLILLFHHIVDDNPNTRTKYLTSDFQNISDYLKIKEDAGELEVMNFSEYYDLYVAPGKHSLTGDNSTGSYGVFSSYGKTNVIDCGISNFYYGIYLFDSPGGGLVEKCNVSTTHWTGKAIRAFNSDANAIKDTDAFSATSQAIYLSFGSDYNLLKNVNARSNSGEGAIRVENSQYNAIEDSSAFSDFGVGLYIYNNADYNYVRNSSGTSNGNYGIFIYKNSNNNFLVNLSGFGKAGIYLSNSDDTKIKSSRFYSNSTYGAMLLAYADNNVIEGSSFIGDGVDALEFYSDLRNRHNKFVNNTFVSASKNLVSVNSLSYNNTFYWNNFTSTCGMYVDDDNGNNHYSSDTGIQVEGNVWANILDGTVDISGTAHSTAFPNLYIGDSGPGYPYNNVNSLGKVSSGVIDYAPITREEGHTLIITHPIWECGGLSQPNSIYSLSSNLYANDSTCLTVLAPNVTLYCNGFSIIGDNSFNHYGIFSDQYGTLISDCAVSNFDVPIFFSGASYGKIKNTLANSTANYYVYPTYSVAVLMIYNSTHNTIENLTADSANSKAIVMSEGSNYNAIANSAIYSKKRTSLLFYMSSYNRVFDTYAFSEESSGIGAIFDSNSNTFVNSTGVSLISSGLSLYGSHANIFDGLRAESSFGNAVLLQESGDNLFLGGIFASKLAVPVQLEMDSERNIFQGNTFSSINGIKHLVKIYPGSRHNTFFWNNFTETSRAYVYDADERNYFNNSISGVPQGNYWANIGLLEIYDSDSDGWGDSGPDYPYCESTSGSKLIGGVDFGPVTTKSAP